MQGTLLKPEARTETTASEDQNTPVDQSGVMLFIDVADFPADAEAGALSVNVEAKDPSSGKYVSVESLSIKREKAEKAVEAGEIFSLVIPGTELPRVWRVKIEHADAEPWTYSVGASPLR